MSLPNEKKRITVRESQQSNFSPKTEIQKVYDKVFYQQYIYSYIYINP